ncbi:MAG: orotidine-5'-phosphate decarboxylase [Alphaproteobacteria bacterium]|nr:orotidine-5'-phosphate decarboxylase [Alphaproteobacteria bacterium]
MNNPVYCAIDTRNVATAIQLAAQVKDHIGGIKLGLEFFLAHGMDGYNQVAATGIPIFLDVKLHDIPNTVSGAVKSLLPLKPSFITVHTSGGAAMMKAAAEAAKEVKGDRPKLLGVTVLTSLDTNDLASVGQNTDMNEQVLRLAKLARESGIDGVVCSPAEVSMLRKELGPDFILMVPGIRPLWAASNDQKRITTPHDAIKSGATYLVIGRPITSSGDPAGAAARIFAELAG